MASRLEQGAGAAIQTVINKNVLLLVPSLGTNDHSIPHEIATSALHASLVQYPLLHGKITLCEPETSIILNSCSHISGLKFHQSDHLDLKNVLSLKPTALVVECNWRFAPNVNLLSKAIHQHDSTIAKKAGECAGCTSAVVEQCYPIQITSDHILRSQYGLEWLIFVRTPNLNPNRPDCIEGDDRLKLAQESLERTYIAVFESFLCISSKESSEDLQSSLIADDHSRTTSSSAKFGVYQHPGKAQNSGGNWKRALYNILDREKQQSHQVYYSDSDCVVIYDGFAKAVVHLLVLPRVACFEHYITHPSHLSKHHLPALSRLHKLAYRIARHLSTTLNDLPVRVGYHSMPSMEPLHIHIISQDFHSVCMKNKKHWNSFMSPFFVDAEQLQLNIESGEPPLSPVMTSMNGKLDPKFGELLDAPLVCQTPACGCKKSFHNMPGLKQHMSDIYHRAVVDKGSKKMRTH